MRSFDRGPLLNGLPKPRFIVCYQLFTTGGLLCGASVSSECYAGSWAHLLSIPQISLPIGDYDSA